MIILAPLLAAALSGILAITGRAQRLSPAVGVIATAISVAVALSANGATDFGVEWLRVGSFQITLGVHLDHLALLLVCVVCTVSLLVQIYSIGYMAGETGYA